MNRTTSEGESSCKRQENGDFQSGSERPLKKARFAWQVKGKYHLKNDSRVSEKQVVNNHNECSSSSDSETDANMGNTEQNLEILGDYLLKQDFNTLDSVMSESERCIIVPCSSGVNQKVLYPKYVPSVENRPPERNEGCFKSNPFTTLQLTEDECIKRWQAMQMAKGFVDNTINSVLDSWMAAPLQMQLHTEQEIALGVADFVNNLPSDNSVENEGILMAISAHGLQNTSNSSTIGNEDNQIEQTSNSLEAFPSPPSSPISSDDESPFYNNIQTFEQGPFSKLSIYPNVSSSCENNVKSNYTVENPNEDDIFANSIDFMDTAISFAIQSKGLTSFGSDYG